MKKLISKINLCFIKIIQKTKGAYNYSPEKRGVKLCTPSKKKCLDLESPSTSSCPPPDIHRQPINLGHVKKSLLSEISSPGKPCVSHSQDVVGQIHSANAVASQSTEVMFPGNKHVTDMPKNPQVIVGQMDGPYTVVPQSSGSKGCANTGYSITDDDLDDDILLSAEKSFESLLQGKNVNTSAFANSGEKPKTALEEFQMKLLNESPQPCTSTQNTNPLQLGDVTSAPGLQPTPQQAVAQDASSAKAHSPSNATSGSIKCKASSDVSPNGGPVQGLFPLAQQVISQDPDSPTSHSQQNPAHSSINCQELPCVTHQSTNCEAAIGMAEQPTAGVPTLPTDAVSFEQALHHVSDQLSSDFDNFGELTKPSCGDPSVGTD